ncbi:hypothetical protein [Roseateles puraquae]|uniref:Uncharacterized protein n=1 Tax=Roseateles puraquae TaxID=431059 RepID=A0A254N0E7_9BURK|nr:hypothetical protein [Roseateles puraquae]MDG0856794.1 hypothetical protein [Roseateles puraquae]OWR01779.1 hypothetical protein CDO81_22375 [Roseateles puraquae]
MRGVIVLLLGLAAALAQARDISGCTPGIESALRALNPKQPITGALVSAQCKGWPPGRGKVLAAVMAFEQAPRPDRRWVGVLALVNTQRLQLLNSHRFEIAEESGIGVDDNSLRLDTAPYDLAPGLRALGLRYASSAPGPSAADAGFGDELTLFVPEGHTLRPVFGMSMLRTRAVEGCLGKCPHAAWDTASFTIAIGPPGPMGWNDLHVTATVVRNSAAATAQADATPQRQRLVYRYTGNAYRQEASPFDWDDYCCRAGGPAAR